MPDWIPRPLPSDWLAGLALPLLAAAILLAIAGHNVALAVICFLGGLAASIAWALAGFALDHWWHSR